MAYRFVELYMLKTCRNREDCVSAAVLNRIDVLIEEYGALVQQHLVPLAAVFKAELRNPKWHIQVTSRTLLAVLLSVAFLLP